MSQQRKIQRRRALEVTKHVGDAPDNRLSKHSRIKLGHQLMLRTQTNTTPVRVIPGETHA